MFRRIFLSGILLSTLLLASVIANAWEYKISKQYSARLVDILELSNQDILISYLDIPYWGGVYTNYLLRISKDGQFVSEIQAKSLFPDSQVCVTNMELINGQILLYTSVGNYSNGFVPALMKTTEELLPLWDTVYRNYPDFAIYGSFQFKDGHFIQYTKHGPFYNEAAFVSMTNDFQIDMSFVLPTANSPDFIGRQPVEHVFYGTTSSQIVTVYDDSTLHLIRSGEKDGVFHTESFALKDNTMLIAGEYDHLRNHTFPFVKDNDLIIYRLDQTLNTIDSLIINIEGTDQVCAMDQSMLSIGDDLFFGGTENFGYEFPKYIQIEPKSRPFILFKINQDLEVIWQKQFYEDASCSLSRILNTKDDGILLAGTCYNWQINSNRKELDLHIIKLNTNGNHVGIHHDLSDRYPKLQIFPNPAYDQVQIIIPSSVSSGELSVSDALGRQVYYNPEFNKRADLNITALEPGIYTVHFKSENYTGSARLVKEQ